MPHVLSTRVKRAFRAIRRVASSGRFGLTRASAIGAAGLAMILCISLLASVDAISQITARRPPPTLHETGLYADGATLQIDPGHLAFEPQYPLWTDGAAKRRWISIPPGSAIDASDPNAWVFPAGVRLWKEFSFGGRPVETRFMELHADGQWRYAAYAWSPDGREALLTSEKGRRGAYPFRDGRSHSIPSVSDCKACHQGGRTEVLGFSALQLSRDRDPAALHIEQQSDPIVDLNSLAAAGKLVGLLTPLLESPPRIAAASAEERAALGYLHANCGHCHNDAGSLKNIGLFLRQAVGRSTQSAIATTVGYPIKKRAPGQSAEAELRIDALHPERSGLVQRIASRYPALQMPPLGTELVDSEAVALLSQWISQMQDMRGAGRKEGD
ncbi:MAG: hypothetical protein ABW003_14295 [Microvirga sp.]